MFTEFEKSPKNGGKSSGTASVKNPPDSTRRSKITSRMDDRSDNYGGTKDKITNITFESNKESRGQLKMPRSATVTYRSTVPLPQMVSKKLPALEVINALQSRSAGPRKAAKMRRQVRSNSMVNLSPPE